MKSFSVRVLVQCSLLVAISIILSRFFSLRIPIGEVEALRIGFGTFPIILAGFLFGPIAGAMVGSVASLLGAIISGIGPPLPHFVLVAALGGVCPVIFWKILGSRRNYVWLFISIGLSMMINTVGLVSFFMNDLFGVPYAFMLPGRFIAWLIMAPIYPYFLLRIWKYMGR